METKDEIAQPGVVLQVLPPVSMGLFADDMAAALGVSRRQLEELERRHPDFPAGIKIGGQTSRRLYNRDAVRRWFDEQVAPSPPRRRSPTKK